MAEITINLDDKQTFSWEKQNDGSYNLIAKTSAGITNLGNINNQTTIILTGTGDRNDTQLEHVKFALPTDTKSANAAKFMPTVRNTASGPVEITGNSSFKLDGKSTQDVFVDTTPVELTKMDVTKVMTAPPAQPAPAPGGRRGGRGAQPVAPVAQLTGYKLSTAENTIDNNGPNQRTMHLDGRDVAIGIDPHGTAAVTFIEGIDKKFSLDPTDTVDVSKQRLSLARSDALDIVKDALSTDAVAPAPAAGRGRGRGRGPQANQTNQITQQEQEELGLHEAFTKLPKASITVTTPVVKAGAGVDSAKPYKKKSASADDIIHQAIQDALGVLGEHKVAQANDSAVLSIPFSSGKPRTV